MPDVRDTTEAEWEVCTDPEPMLRFLRGKASDRKLRLFACACCRRIWDRLSDGRSKAAVDAAELFADGLISDRRRRAAAAAADLAAFDPDDEAYDAAVLAASLAAAAPLNAVDVAESAAQGVCRSEKELAREKAYQATSLRCIFGNPLCPVFADPAWLSWNAGAIPKMAQAIYDDRAFERLPLLADALKDAGCDRAAILSHCRRPGEHVRGCWAVDLLLGKT
jgi:hypothetical protein